MLNISLSESQQQVILGGLLGDSYYKFTDNSIRFYHCEKQLDYLKWKYDLLNIDYKISQKVMFLEKYNKFYNEFYFSIGRKYTKEIFPFIEKNLYKTNSDGNYVKKISMKYLNEINPLGLAIWWMDDGCLSVCKGRRYGKLCTHSFNYEENILIKKFLKDKYDIESSVKVEKNKYYFIRLNVPNLKKMIKIIYPYVCEIKSMIYKIDLKYSNLKCLDKDQDFKNIYYYIKSQYNNEEF